MQRAVITIGVRKTGGLPELTAARQSAALVAEWAVTHQRIPKSRVKLITDEKRHVTRDRIFEAVESITKLGFIEQLIVYFSGHGINSGLYEQWLLSKAPDDPGAAVNLKGSEALARYAGIGHVVFVSDACRTAADSIQAQGIAGGEIFPNPKARGAEGPVDQFFATLVGNPAYEVKTVADAVSRYRAAYSTIMLDALRGGVSSLVETTTDGRLVRPRPLKRHLAVAVPEFMNTLSLPGGETQQPDARIESDSDAWLAEVPAGAGASRGSTTSAAKRTRRAAPAARSRSAITDDAPLPEPGVVKAAQRPADLAKEASGDLLAVLDPAASATRKRRGPQREEVGRARGPASARLLLDRAIAKGATRFGPDHFETECGIKVRGGRLVDAYARNADAVVGTRRDVVQVSLHGSRSGANVVVVLADGSAVVVPAFRDYITGLTFDEDGNLDDISCEPSANTLRWQAWQYKAREIGQLRAVIAAASSLGVFRLDHASQGDTLLQRMRDVKSFDPALAVYAAYAFHDRRMRSEIADMQRFLDRDLHARIFDVAMLALSLGRKRTPDEPTELYPFVPMLTQGWALLSAFGVTLPKRLAETRALLKPSLWTHFTPAAVGLLIDTLRNGKVE